MYFMTSILKTDLCIRSLEEDNNWIQLRIVQFINSCWGYIQNSMFILFDNLIDRCQFYDSFTTLKTVLESLFSDSI